MSNLKLEKKHVFIVIYSKVAFLVLMPIAVLTTVDGASVAEM